MGFEMSMILKSMIFCGHVGLPKGKHHFQNSEQLIHLNCRVNSCFHLQIVMVETHYLFKKQKPIYIVCMVWNC
jgi:hypothetical protein